MKEAVKFVQSLEDVNALKQDSFTLLHILMSYETTSIKTPGVPAFREVFDALLEKGIDVNARDKKGNTALHNAAGLGLPYYVKRLIEKGANLHLMNKDGLTPFLSVTYMMLLGAQPNLEVMDILLENGAKINAQIGMHETTGYTEGQLSKFSASEDNLGATALMLAVALKNKPLIKYLMEKGADPAIKNKKGISAIDMAKQIGDEEIIKMVSKSLFFLFDF